MFVIDMDTILLLRQAQCLLTSTERIYVRGVGRLKADPALILKNYTSTGSDTGTRIALKGKK